jgi:hypothetical protein
MGMLKPLLGGGGEGEDQRRLHSQGVEGLRWGEEGAQSTTISVAGAGPLNTLPVGSFDTETANGGA